MPLITASWMRRQVEIVDAVSCDTEQFYQTSDGDDAEMINESDSTEPDCNDADSYSTLSPSHLRDAEESSTPSPALATLLPALASRSDKLLRLHGLMAANGNRF